MNQKWSQPEAETYIPNGETWETALGRTTHLSIGAHQDDLEIMAIDGILSCFDDEGASFTGVVASDGRGSARSGAFSQCSDEEMRLVRRAEQRKAADLGRYGALVQLDHHSSTIKEATTRQPLLADLEQLFLTCRPRVVYTHSLFDLHATHVAVALSVIDVLRTLPKEQQPEQVIGCEVWQDLDWLPESHKIIMDVSSRLELQRQLLESFESQVAGGKRYDLAALGRRRAHATFCQSHRVDHSQGLVYGMDLRPLVSDPCREPGNYISFLIEEFHRDTSRRLSSLL